MITESTRQFDLYDFFSVFIPGSVFLIGLFPFLPHETSVSSTVLIGVLIVLGFVFGRGIHALGLLLEGPDETYTWSVSVGSYVLGIENSGVATSHRGYFVNEVSNANEISQKLVVSFYNHAVEYFDDVELEVEWSSVDCESHEDELESLYTLVRSTVHMDARGRSRTFQAVLDFQRTMVVTTVLLFLIYSLYAILVGAEGMIDRISIVESNPLADGLVGYETYISHLGLPWWGILLGAVVVLVSSYITFERVRSNYRRYFIQYLMADFISLRESEPERR